MGENIVGDKVGEGQINHFPMFAILFPIWTSAAHELRIWPPYFFTLVHSFNRYLVEYFYHMQF